MRLTGDAARQWIANNPGASYLDGRTGQMVGGQQQPIPMGEQDPKQGFWKSLLMGVTKPLRTGVGIGAEFVNTGKQLVGAAQGDWSKPKKDYWWLTDEEKEELEYDPLRVASKSVAGLGAYAIPGGAAAGTVGTGARIGQAAGRGAIAGGMGGFGYSKEGEELKGLGTGAAFGGALGGLFQGGKEVATKVRAAREAGEKGLVGKVGESLENPRVRPSVRKGGINTQAEADAVAKNMRTTIKENLELARDVRPDLVRKYQKATISQTEKTELFSVIADEANKRASGLRAGVGEPIDVARLQEKLVKSEFLQKNPTAHKALRKEGFFEDLSRLGEKGVTADNKMAQYASVEDLYGFLKENVDSSLNYGSAKGTIESPLKRAYDAMQRLIRNEIENKTGPRYLQYNDIMSNYFRAKDAGILGNIANDELGRNFARQSSTPILGDIIDAVPVREGVGRIKNAMGVGLQNLDNLPVAAAPAISGLMGAGQRAIPAMPAIQDAFGVGQPAQPAQPTQLGEMGLGVPQPEMGGGLNKMALAQAVLGGEISATEANFLLKMFESEDKALDPKAKDALRIVDEIEGLVDRVGLQESAFLGKVTGPARTLGGAVGLDPELEMYNDTIKGFSAKLSRAMGESGMLTDRDIVRALNLFPKITDSQAIAKEKLNRLRDFLSQAMSTPAQTAEPTVGVD